MSGLSTGPTHKPADGKRHLPMVPVPDRDHPESRMEAQWRCDAIHRWLRPDRTVRDLTDLADMNA